MASTECRDCKNQILFVREVLSLCVYAMLKRVIGAVTYVLVNHHLFAWRSTAHSEDYLLLFGHEHFGFTNQHQHLLVDELAAEFRQEEASAYKQLVVSTFVPERSVFGIYSCLALGMDYVLLTQQLVELVVCGIDIDLV